ncbi:hypothetical protein MTR67_037793 [Solanum verrucosum]|uniref:Uncharacterized protein n=1 Tax=Solanum verrucosum TaxID=315347 RepID=A0AAF0UE43_SOLVR|nr:hypothetical protein MTR67_037793 [Solanum verrucosum]
MPIDLKNKIHRRMTIRLVGVPHQWDNKHLGLVIWSWAVLPLGALVEVIDASIGKGKVNPNPTGIQLQAEAKDSNPKGAEVVGHGAGKTKNRCKTQKI